MFTKFKKIHVDEDYGFCTRFKKVFPELGKIDTDELKERLDRLGVYFYEKEKINTPFWLRLTMPFAFTIMVLMYVLSPINYFVTGSFYYDLDEDNILLNWFRATKLLK